jgi:hypothetical protein
MASEAPMNVEARMSNDELPLQSLPFIFGFRRSFVLCH